MQVGRDGLLQKREEVTALFLAGCDGRPHPFVIAPPGKTARTLRDAAVDHALADLLFAVIVRRLDAFGEHEPEVVLRQIVLARFRGFPVDVIDDREPRSKVRGLLGRRRIANDIEKAISMRQHGTMKTLGRHLVAAVPGRKHPPRPIQKPLGPRFGSFIRMLFEEPDITYQMRPTVLGFDPIVPRKGTVGREIVEIQITLEFATDELFQHFTRT